jgi:primosomal replication protein N
MLLNHESEVHEAGVIRRIELIISAVALGDIALLLADTPLGAALSIEGFLAAARKGSNKLVLHIQQADRVFAGGATAVV